MTPGSLAGQTLVITGGSRGIGRAIVDGALDRGANVVLCARHPDNTPLSDVTDSANRVLTVRADVSREQDVERLFGTALDRFGRVDVAVNNAGISRDALLVSTTVDQWDDVIATNLTGAFLVARCAIRTFVASNRAGRIINVGSVMQNGAPSNASYATSKGGLIGLTEAIELEYGDRGIQGHLVVVGYVETTLTGWLSEETKRSILAACPARRAATANEIAELVLYLAGGQALGLSGRMIHATGGLLQVPC